jgi:hypothetical protein
MSKSILRTPALTYLVGLSLFGLFLAGMLSIYPPMTPESFVWRRPLIGSVFSLICILGILAVFFPKQCSGMFDAATRGKREPSALDGFPSHGASPAMKGHHPDCEGFSPHVFRIGNRTFCTACTGLLLGGLAALAGTVMYFFGEWNIISNSSLLVWIGVVGVGLGLFQFKVKATAIRLSLNAFFVLGTFLILVGADELAQNVFADMFLVLLAIFWLFTRIVLSQWDHRRICHTCRVDHCELADERKKRD